MQGKVNVKTVFSTPFGQRGEVSLVSPAVERWCGGAESSEAVRGAGVRVPVRRAGAGARGRAAVVGGRGGRAAGRRAAHAVRAAPGRAPAPAARAAQRRPHLARGDRRARVPTAHSFHPYSYFLK